MIRRILFYFNRGKDAAAEAVRACALLCRAQGFETCFFSEDAAWLDAHAPGATQDSVLLERPVPGETDLILVFGGDGTVLRALDSYVCCNIPMLGVNLGRMGFLLETQPQEMGVALEQLRMGKYRIERRMMLCAH